MDNRPFAGLHLSLNNANRKAHYSGPQRYGHQGPVGQTGHLR